MAKNKISSHEKPLLFINQVNNKLQTKQQAFVMKKAEVHHDRQSIKKTEVPVSVNEAQADKAPEDQVIEQPRKKRITEMNIEEKIVHLLNLPNNMPKILCDFTTEQESYKGIVVGFEDGVIALRTFPKSEVINIKVHQLKTVNVLGF
jgi:hypothetical protein